ncbi:MAG TPA: ABC transporter permease [Terracidiphilus sp.]|jgi:predicted permease|nr:ABC transporter permease [Terracidiphilus sp.]
MNSFLQDLRYAARQLRKAPGFTLTAVLTLALGIGALTTVATWTNAVLFNPWPRVENPRALRFISATILGSNGYSVHWDQLQFVRRQSRSFSDGAAFSLTSLTLQAQGSQAQGITAGIVSSNYFQLLGVQPEAGSFFQASANDRSYSSNDTVVLSDGLWHDRFNADPTIIGRTVTINRHAFTVIGIAPRDFTGIFGGLAESAWVPFSAVRDLSADASPDPLETYGLQVVVRMRPAVSDATAAAELHTLAHTFALAKNDSKYNGWDLNLDDSAHFQRGLFSTIGEQLPVLLGASALLMILVCLNIASLLGQHSARRRREVAIRTALGARPARIASQVFAEMGLLALLGALSGWAASIAMSRALYALLPNFGVPLAFNLRTDLRIVLFIAAVAAVVTVACGLFPVRQALRISQRAALHEGSAAVAGPSRNRLGQRILLGVQLGICFVVLVCCGLLTRTALNIFHRDAGFDRANCLTAYIDLSRSAYTDERSAAFRSALLDRLRALPSVSGATLTTHLPLGDEGSGNTRDFGIPGYVPAKSEEMNVVTDYEGSNFFRTMGIALQQGRDFAAQDNQHAPFVAIVNEDMAHRYWPYGNALGSTIIVDKLPHRIVGIVRNYMYHNPGDTDPNPVVFLPLAQGASGYGYFILAVRERYADASMGRQIRQAVADLDASVPVEDMRTLEQVTGEQYQMSRIPAELLGVYGICSVLVAMMGLYAVMAYSVIERNREFALRMALGSSRARIFRLVLTGSSSVALIGLVTGGLGAIAAVRLLRSMLFGVTAFDPVSFCAAAILLLFTVFFSGLAPARRAAAIEPMQALRSE